MPLVVRLLAILTGLTGAAAIVTTLITVFNAIATHGFTDVGASTWILCGVLIASAAAAVLMSLAMSKGGTGYRYLLNLVFVVIAVVAIWVAFTVGDDYADPAAIITAILALGALTMMNVANSSRNFFTPTTRR